MASPSTSLRTGSVETSQYSFFRVRDLIRSLPVRSASGLPVYLAASPAARFSTSVGMTEPVLVEQQCQSCDDCCSLYNLVRVFGRTRSNMPRSIDPRSYESPEGERPVVTPPVELKRRPHDPYAAFRFGGFSLFTAGNLLSITGRLMLAVAVEWEIYARTHSATALGLVGLVIAVPVVTLSLPAGHLADRFSRRRIILVAQIFSALASAALALVSWKHLSIPPIAPLRAGNHALVAIAQIFERHRPAFYFDDASITLIYLLLFIRIAAQSFSWAALRSFFPPL